MKTVTLTSKKFNAEVHKVLSHHCLNVLGYRGFSKYIEELVRKDFAKRGEVIE